METKWYENWFNTPYYHILYKNRNTQEAAQFIDNLFEHFHPEEHATLLDIACGRGRHARYMSDKGFITTGIDLSESSIAYARKFENGRLQFVVQDMRKKYCSNCFDYAFNLFTSFGYFQTKEEHIQALAVFYDALKPNGTFVLDFFNAERVLAELVPLEIKNEGGIIFRISKHLENQKIIKTIEFEHKGEHHRFVEEVFAFTLKDFREMLEMCNFTVVEEFGDYQFAKFDQQKSPRLILICKKLCLTT